jgi:hypothetical protein
MGAVMVLVVTDSAPSYPALDGRLRVHVDERHLWGHREEQRRGAWSVHGRRSEPEDRRQ